MLLRLISLLALVVLLPTLATSASAGAGAPTPTPTLPVAPTASPTIPATVTPSVTGIPTASATTIPTVTGTVGALADLLLTVQASPNPVAANQILSFFITVVNQGGTTSQPTRLTASIPAGTILSAGFGCVINPFTGLQDCSGTSPGTCFVNPNSGVVDCSNLGNCFVNTTTGALTCTGTNLPANCFVNLSTGVVTCSGTGLPPGCFVNQATGVVICSTPTLTPSVPNCFINQTTGLLQCSTTTIGSGCTQVTVGNIVDCPIPSLAPGASTNLTLTFQVTAASGTIFQQVRVDPENLVPENNESNNVVSLAVGVIATAGGVAPLPPPFFEPTPVPTAVPTVVFPTFPPAPPTPVPVPTQPAPQGSLWLHVLQPTQAYSVTMDPLWVAQPGEWYYVVQQEAGWALAVWEGDTADWSVWIQEDARVELVIADRPIPQLPLWLIVVAPTQVYSVTMDLLWIAQPGERYKVRDQEEGWALVIWEGDPPSMQEWIQIDARVTFTRM